jgi:CRP-like cAMP-binding protein
MFGLAKQKLIPFVNITRLEKIEKKIIISVVNRKKMQKFTFGNNQEASEVYAIANPIWTSLVSQNPQSSTTVVRSPLLPHISPSKLKARGVAGLPCKEEWDEILKGAKLMTFKKGQIIVEEGTEHRKMYQISKGNCTVEKDLPPRDDDDEENSSSDEEEPGPRRQVVNRLKDGDMFGEISFLLECPATVNVIADSEEVDIYILEISFVNALLNTRPAITPKFYRFLASTLMNRMQFFEQKKGAKLSKYKRSMMQRVNRSIATMRGEHKSILESLRAQNAAAAEEGANTNAGKDEEGSFGLTKLKV